MTREYSLAHLTVLALPPTEMIDVAARAGYQYVGLRLNRVTPAEPLYPLMTDRGSMRDAKARLAATGVRVLDVELARMDPEHDPQSYIPLLEAAAELGARYVITQLPDPDRARATERFGAICERAAPLGLGIDLEFPSWTQTPDLAEATRILRAVRQPNAGILVDMLHFDRSNSSLDLLKALPREWFRFAHVCDAPAEKPTSLEGLIHTARSERQFPGDGGIDVRGILACLPPDIPYALEIPGDTLAAKVGLAEYARLALKRTQEHLDTVGVSADTARG
ncbi:MAG: TIM barrel protein [Acidobacteria bacterium]|nr:TIM barrel protein [Acidobacteriota bacterium]